MCRWHACYARSIFEATTHTSLTPSFKKRKRREEEGDDISIDKRHASAGESDDDDVLADADRSTKNAYTARVIKELRFDFARGRHKVDDDPRNLFPAGPFGHSPLFIHPADGARVMS